MSPGCRSPLATGVPPPTCAWLVRGMEMPASWWAHEVRPEQSNEPGPVAPQAYGVPSWAFAASTICWPAETSGAGAANSTGSATASATRPGGTSTPSGTSTVTCSGTPGRRSSTGTSTVTGAAVAAPDPATAAPAASMLAAAMRRLVELVLMLWASTRVNPLSSCDSYQVSCRVRTRKAVLRHELLPALEAIHPSGPWFPGARLGRLGGDPGSPPVGGHDFRGLEKVTKPSRRSPATDSGGGFHSHDLDPGDHSRLPEHLDRGANIGGEHITARLLRQYV